MPPEPSAITENIDTDPSTAHADPNSGKRATNVGDAERWASVIGGGVLLLSGLKRGSLSGTVMALMGGGLAYRGASGHCMTYEWLGVTPQDATQMSNPLSRTMRGRKSITVNRPVEDVYRFWRDLDNLPKVMTQLCSVRAEGSERSHWVGVGPAGERLEWDALITEERENERIAWRSLSGADVEHGGEVEFRKAPGGRGTEVKLSYWYRPPFGVVGAAAARMLQAAPEDQVDQGLGRMKQLLEAGEIATSQKPSWREQLQRRVHELKAREKSGRPRTPGGEDVVTEGSEESFPASDPPSWASGHN